MKFNFNNTVDLTKLSNEDAFSEVAGHDLVKQVLKTCTAVEIQIALDNIVKLTATQREYILKKLDAQSNSMKFTFNSVQKSNGNSYLYCIVECGGDTQKCLLASTASNSKCYVAHVGELLDVVKKLDVYFFLSDLQYNDILNKLWYELSKWIDSTDNTLSLYDSFKQQVTSLLEFKRIDVLFIEYFANYHDVEITALFPEIITPQGYVQSYSHTGQHSEAHTDLLHCRHSEFNEYRDLLKELLELGYNLKVLNQN